MPSTPVCRAGLYRHASAPVPSNLFTALATRFGPIRSSQTRFRSGYRAPKPPKFLFRYENGEFVKAEQPSPAPRSQVQSDVDPAWCHPIFGFSYAEIPRIICIKISPMTTEEDVKALFSAMNQAIEKVMMQYDRFVGRSNGYCFVQVSNSHQAQSALENLTTMSLFGEKVKASLLARPNTRGDPLFHAGWFASSTSDPDHIKQRPSLTSPPESLFKPIREGRRLQLLGLPESARESILPRLYTWFHDSNVEGIGTSFFQRQQRSFKGSDAPYFIQFATKEEADAGIPICTGKKIGLHKIRAQVDRIPNNMLQKLEVFKDSRPESSLQSELEAWEDEKLGQILWSGSRHDRSQWGSPESVVSRLDAK